MAFDKKMEKHKYTDEYIEYIKHIKEYNDKLVTLVSVSSTRYFKPKK